MKYPNAKETQNQSRYVKGIANAQRVNRDALAESARSGWTGAGVVFADMSATS
jgi:hypothetical protein